VNFSLPERYCNCQNKEGDIVENKQLRRNVMEAILRDGFTSENLKLADEAVMSVKTLAEIAVHRETLVKLEKLS